MISFLLLSTSSASVEFYKLATLDKMILLAVKLSRLDVSSVQRKQAFNFPLNFIYHPGNAVSNFLNSIFIVKKVVLLFSVITV